MPDKRDSGTVPIPRRRTIQFCVLAGSIILLFATVWIVDGRPALEKLLQRLATPLCLSWIGIATALVVSVRARKRLLSGLLLTCWLLLTLGGNGWAATAGRQRLGGDGAHYSIGERLRRDRSLRR